MNSTHLRKYPLDVDLMQIILGIISRLVKQSVVRKESTAKVS